jgi:hypothetical protein
MATNHSAIDYHEWILSTHGRPGPLSWYTIVLEDITINRRFGHMQKINSHM